MLICRLDIDQETIYEFEDFTTEPKISKSEEQREKKKSVMSNVKEKVIKVSKDYNMTQA